MDYLYFIKLNKKKLMQVNEIDLRDIDYMYVTVKVQIVFIQKLKCEFRTAF